MLFVTDSTGNPGPETRNEKPIPADREDFAYDSSAMNNDLHEKADGKPKIRLSDLIAELRPGQWTKNAIIPAAFFFAFWDVNQRLDIRISIFKVISAMLLFCLTSGAIYVLNDIMDAPADRRHPLKRFRPIASGRISIPLAWSIFIILLAVSGALSFMLSRPFFWVTAGYIGLQSAYSLFLKQAPIVDVLVIAAGFVLRAIAGAAVLAVNISPWLLLCTFLLALFLALCKRRHEKVLLDNVNGQRASLEKYDERLLDQLIAITSSATIVSYSIYTLSPATVDKFGTFRLGFTIPFVVFGIFRYLDLVYRHEKGDRPEKILLTDTPILINLALYILSLITVFVLRNANI